MNDIKIDGFPEITIYLNSVSDPVICGVYFLFDHYGRVIYVGESTDIYKRIRNHKNNKKIVFSYYSYIVSADKEKRKSLEAYYIHALSPRCNLHGNPVWMRLCARAYTYLISKGREREMPRFDMPGFDRVDAVLREMGVKNPCKKLQ